MAVITSEAALRDLYGEPGGRAVLKAMATLERHSRRFIELSPFCLLASSDPTGKADVTPRGGAPGFVQAIDDRHLLLPDWPGNNRLDSLVNIAANPEVGVLFLIPGVDETLRVNGTGEIDDDATLRARFATAGRLPRTVLRIAIREAFLHCAKAMMRSGLWSEEARQERAVLPTMGRMLNDQIGTAEPPESQAAMVERYKSVLHEGG